jgi:hypothetical protein
MLAAPLLQAQVTAIRAGMQDGKVVKSKAGQPRTATR